MCAFNSLVVLSTTLVQSPKVPYPSLAPPLISMCRKLGAKSTSGIAKFRPGKMAAPLELSCWGGGWGLPSVHSESLVVMVRTHCGPGPGKEGGGATGEKLDGPGTSGLQQFPTALLAAPPWAPCSLQTSYNLACDSTAAWRESRSFSTWL